MMGHKEKLKDGYEYDLIFWRRSSGRHTKWKIAKKRLNKRIRREVKLKIKKSKNYDDIND